MADCMQSLWVGGRLSTMEQLAIRSFLHYGHEYHLYCYQPVENVPPGAVVFDAASILPATAIFEYAEFKSVAGFSNFFRYKLLAAKGGWWVDTDVVCLRPFDFPTPYVFASEYFRGEPFPSSGIFKCPPNSAAMQDAWEVCRAKHTPSLRWGETGPRLVAEVIARHSLEGFLQPPSVFNPVASPDWRRVLEPARSVGEFPGAYSLHLWNEMWRRIACDKDSAFDPTCIYEQLKRLHQVGRDRLAEAAGH